MYQKSLTLFRPINLVLTLVLMYAAYHMLFSSKGVIAHHDLKKRYAIKVQVLDELQKQHDELTQEVKGLSPDNPSYDMLEEIVKSNFGYVRTNEIMVVNIVDEN